MNRPNPDELLKHVQAEESVSHRGKLKLFFGASPGVGKTYAMLEAARQRKKEGWDVLVGLVETHGRSETAALLDGLEILPRKDVVYGGVLLKEFDLDAALARRPRLLLVDELAHTNAPGLRHAKRWQDIEELLDAGIDVYTTLNVQHWESLNDIVAKITSVVVRETVPDTFLRRANDLELVDLAPEDLLKRMKEGKVYRGELAGRATDNFFKPGNLIALRELALRHAAERVDEQMRAFKDRHAIGEVWPVGERLLVGVSASPNSATLIRATSRLATRLKAPWIAMHVETPASLRLPERERLRAIDHMRLAERMGGEVVSVSGDDVTAELIAMATSRNVTHIVLGKPARPRWQEWFFGSIVNEVARRSGNIDLHVISGVGASQGGQSDRSSYPRAWWGQSKNFLMGLAGAAVLAWGITFFGGGFHLSFIVLAVASLFITALSNRLHAQAQALRERVDRTRILHKLSRTLSETPHPKDILVTAKTILEEYYRMPVVILGTNATGALEESAGPAATFEWNDHEKSVAQWVFDHGEIAGAGSDTLAGAHGLYLPFQGRRGTIGVLGLKPDDPKSFLAPDRLQLLESFAAEIGSALESTRMSEEIGRAEVQMERRAMAEGHKDGTRRLSDFLTPERILVVEDNLVGEELLQTLLSKLDLKNRKAALQAILQREKTGATLIGSSVAIPHARLEGLQEIQAAMAVSKKGPRPVSILFVSPASDPKAHLAFLAQVAAFFQNADRTVGLLAFDTPEDIYAYLRQ